MTIMFFHQFGIEALHCIGDNGNTKTHVPLGFYISSTPSLTMTVMIVHRIQSMQQKGQEYYGNGTVLVQHVPWENLYILIM